MALSADDPWLTHLPLLHRILAGGESPSAYPQMPRGDDVYEYCAYWEPLYYLLNTVHGWTDLAAGMAWFYGHGKSDHADPRLALIRRIWDSEGQLDFFAAWTFQQGREHFDLENAARTSALSNDDWWRDFRRRGQPYHRDPFHGGTNALHLGHSHHYLHVDDENDSNWPADSLHLDPASRKAVLVTRDFTTWRQELHAAGRQLPQLPSDRSWHVDVFDRRVSWLGTYRRSRVTGIWFAGKHSVHAAGQ